MSNIERPNMAEGTQGPGPEGGPAGQPPTQPTIIVGPEIEVPAQPPAVRQPRVGERLRAGLQEVRKEFWGERPQSSAASPQPTPQAARPSEQLPAQSAVPETHQAVPPPETLPPPANGDGNDSPEGNREAPESQLSFFYRFAYDRTGRESRKERNEKNNWVREYIWSPEFRAEGMRLVKEIIELEGLTYEKKYGDENSGKLDKLYGEWRLWITLQRKQSILREPLKKRALPDLAEQVKKIEKPPEESIPEQDLEGVPPIVDQKDAEGKVITKGLISTYLDLVRDPDANADQIKDIERYITRYFKEARRLNLLDGIDESLRPLYATVMKGLKSKKSPGKIMKEIKEDQASISSLGEVSFIGRLRSHKREEAEDKEALRKLKKLEGVWEVYTELAVHRFALFLQSKGKELFQPEMVGGEFTFDQATLAEYLAITSDEEYRELAEDDDTVKRLARTLPDSAVRGLAGTDEKLFQDLSRDRKQLFDFLANDRELVFRLLVRQRGSREKIAEESLKDTQLQREMAQERELYWRPMYANYYEVNARTPEQFQIALDTFTQWLRAGLTKSPNEIFQRVNGFKDALTSAGTIANVSTIGYRHELEGLVGVLCADFQNEHYNADYYKQFLDFLAADDGPDRFIRLGRAAGGKVAAALWKLDNDSRFELLFSAHGSRGQLQGERDAIAQNEIRKQILQLLTLELIGAEIKGYDIEDVDMKLSNKDREKNLDEISKFKTDQDFKDLFDGFDEQEQKRVYQQLRQRQYIYEQKQKEIQQSSEQGIPEQEALARWEQEGGVINDAILLNEAEQALFKKLEMGRIIRHYLQHGGEVSGLKGKYAEIYESASNAAQLAYEMYGAMGEKAKRGGAILLVDRKDAEEKEFVDYIPINQAEKFVQFAENWTKATYGGELDEEVKQQLRKERLTFGQQLLSNPKLSQAERSRIEAWMNPQGVTAGELKNRVGQARRLAIWALKTYGFNAKLYDFTLLKDGKAVDTNTLGYDNYGNPNEPMILGYNKRGEPVTLVFNQRGEPIGIPWDDKGQAEIYDQNKQRIFFDNLNQNTPASVMMLKTPKEREDGSFIPALEAVNFEKAINHIYSRWTGHPYWGYQEEDTTLVISKEAFEAAKRIKNGQSRPEDEEPHATQLLLIDPTLQRVVHFFNKESVEDWIALAAVEESYQSHWRITDELYQAFLPQGPFSETARTAYGTQDFGGSTKTWFHARAQAARWAHRDVRRLHTMTSLLPLHFASMADMWGAGGVLNVIKMMGFKQYRMVGLFALQKWVAQTEGASDVYDALFGFRSPQEKRAREGLGEKPTNEADKLRKWIKRIFKQFELNSASNEDIDEEFINDVRETLGRFETVFQRVRVLETDMRGERCPLWLEGIDIFQRNADGSIKISHNGRMIFNKDILEINNVGSSRHSGEIFFWRFVKWLRTDGAKVYPREARYYAVMDQFTLASLREKDFQTVEDFVKFRKEKPEEYKALRKNLETKWEWLLNKINR